MKNFFAKNKIAVTLSIYPLMLAALIIFVIMPYYNRVLESTNKIQETIVGEENKKKRLGELSKLSEQYDKVVKDEEKLLILIGEEKAVEVIERIERVAQETGNEVIIEVISADEKAKATKGKSSDGEEKEQSIYDDLPSDSYLKFKAKLKGDYNDLLNFIEKIENLEYYADITDFQMESVIDPLTNKVKEAQSDSSTAENQKSEEEDAQETVPEKNIVNSSVTIIFYLKGEQKDEPQGPS
jgi:hypothetical protein